MSTRGWGSPVSLAKCNSVANGLIDAASLVDRDRLAAHRNAVDAERGALVAQAGELEQLAARQRRADHRALGQRGGQRPHCASADPGEGPPGREQIVAQLIGVVQHSMIAS